MELVQRDEKPFCSISLDLDNKWSYLKTHGDPDWKEFPSYLDLFIPNVLDLLDEMNLRITFFIVGQDAALKKNHEILHLIAKRGHEVGNHSFNHEPWIRTYSKDRITKEILETEEQINRITGEKPVGFRGPGFSWSPELFQVLAENNYIYDASTLPTYLGPLARMYYFWTSNFSREEKNQLNGLFGGFKDGLRPVKAYWWKLDSAARLLEIPVTTIPIIKTPFHNSYLLYLNRISLKVMISYLRVAIALCRTTRTEPSFLLHPLDLIGKDIAPELAFLPGMDLHSQRKAEIFEMVLKELAQHFKLVNMSCHAESLSRRKGLKVIKLNS